MLIIRTHSAVWVCVLGVSLFSTFVSLLKGTRRKKHRTSFYNFVNGIFFLSVFPLDFFFFCVCVPLFSQKSFDRSEKYISATMLENDTGDQKRAVLYCCSSFLSAASVFLKRRSLPYSILPPCCWRFAEVARPEDASSTESSAGCFARVCPVGGDWPAPHLAAPFPLLRPSRCC
jgi:hypothetical protein